MPYANNNNDQALRKRNRLALMIADHKGKDKDDRTEVDIELCKSIIKILRNNSGYVIIHVE
jgi:hypothetical protein